MFGIGLPELIVILVLGLLVLGPQRLPEVARAIGRGLGELKRAMQDLKEDMDVESRRTDEAAREKSHDTPREDANPESTPDSTREKSS